MHELIIVCVLFAFSAYAIHDIWLTRRRRIEQADRLASRAKVRSALEAGTLWIIDEVDLSKVPPADGAGDAVRVIRP